VNSSLQDNFYEHGEISPYPSFSKRGFGEASHKAENDDESSITKRRRQN
jgi:hypothetical protein